MSAVPATLERLLKSPQLPSVPSVALRLLDLTRDPDSGTKDIVNTIKGDPALAARILKSANSSYFSFRAEVRTLEQAVPLIGRTAITSLALSFSLSQDAMSDGPLARHYQRYWLQSIVQASAAETLAKFGRKGLGSELFMTGLLIDLGRLALLRVLKSDYLVVLDEAEQTGQPLHEVELQRLGVDHAVAGAAIMTAWKLPEVLVQAALLHHSDPDRIPDDSHVAELVQAMMITATVGEYFCGQSQGTQLQRLRDLTRRFLQFDEKKLHEYLAETEVRIKQAADLLSTNTDELPAATELMAQAAEQIAELTVRQAAEQQDAAIQHQQMAEQNQQLREQVLRDALTGLYNRRYFDETLTNEVQRAARRGSPIATIFVDADYFKRLNDNYGHKFGDAVLIRIAEVLQRTVRTADVAARYGGEEFVVLAPDTTEAGLRTLCERIRSTIEAEDIRCNGQRVPVTISVGGATTIPRREDENVANRLLEAADAAMYESKRRGRNCVTVHSMATELERSLSQLIGQFRFSHWLAERNLVEGSVMHELVQKARPQTKHIGELACQRGWLTLALVQAILADQETSRERFGAVAHRMGLLNEVQIAALLAEQTEDHVQLAKLLVQAGLMNNGEMTTLRECFDRDCRECLQTFSVVGAPIA